MIAIFFIIDVFVYGEEILLIFNLDTRLFFNTATFVPYYISYLKIVEET